MKKRFNLRITREEYWYLREVYRRNIPLRLVDVELGELGDETAEATITLEAATVSLENSQ